MSKIAIRKARENVGRCWTSFRRLLLEFHPKKAFVAPPPNPKTPKP